MKPLSLQVEAFGPYLDRTAIDFEKLNEAGLFLISGSTGGGKTTLLDAMCIALYNKSTGGRRSFADMRSLTADTAQRTEVIFTFCLGDTQYRFHRALYMKKKRGSEIYDLHELHECEKQISGNWELQASGSARSVTEYAQKLLSLTAEQFSQVIVLPQGEFLRLLRANSKDKGDILKTLFACESWQKLVSKLGDRHKAIYGKRQNLDAMVQSLLEKHGAADLTSLQMQIETMKDQQGEMKKKLADEQQQAAAAQAALERALSFAQLQKEATTAAAQHSTAVQRLTAAEDTVQENQTIRGELELLNTALLSAERAAEALRQERERSLEKLTVQQAMEQREKQLRQLTAEVQKTEAAQHSAQKSIEAGEAYVAEITQASEAIPALLTKKTTLENDLRLMQDRTIALNEVENCRTELQAKRDHALREKLTVSAQDKAVSAAEAARIHNSAAALAAGLTDGEPCPVCGAIHHPAPACGTSETISEAELTAMREQLEALRKRYNAAENAASAAQARLDLAAQKLEKAEADCAHIAGTLPALQKKLQIISMQLLDAEKKAAHGAAARQKLQRLRETADAAAQQSKTLSAQLSACTGELGQLRHRLQSFSTVRDVENIDRALADQQKRIQTAQAQKAQLEKKLQTAAEAHAAAKELLTASEKRLTAAKEALRAFGPAPAQDADACSAALKAAQDRISGLSVSLGSTAEALESAVQSAASLEKLAAQTAELDAEYSRVTRLHGLLSGQKNSLRMPILQYVLSMMLEETVYSANRYFTIFSRGRYALRRMTAPKSGTGYSGLDIEVLDGMSGTCRSIETLSGGEQFLASLSLAFGLSEVVQANSGVVRMDSIFIDEGFGSLDGDTLDTAMKALETIRQSGRIVGIISHVSELRHRIPTMIRVSHKENGSAAAKVFSE